jgi:hypothetical protein
MGTFSEKKIVDQKLCYEFLNLVQNKVTNDKCTLYGYNYASR